MKKHIILLICVLFAQQAFTQDSIILKNGDEFKALVTEIGSEIIKYKKYENPEGPVYSVNKKEVFMIRYENGTKDVFADEQKAQVTESSDQKSVSQSRPLPKGSFNVNPLGFLQFGPIIQLEVKLGERIYLAPHFRYSYAGLLTHLIWTGFEENSELSPSTLAFGAGLRGFAKNAGSTWYYGGTLDYGHARARYDVHESYETEEEATTLAILVNTGYRWRFSSGNYINLGLFAGSSFDLKAKETSINGTIDDNKETSFFAMLELSFGWDF